MYEEIIFCSIHLNFHHGTKNRMIVSFTISHKFNISFEGLVIGTDKVEHFEETITQPNNVAVQTGN